MKRIFVLFPFPHFFTDSASNLEVKLEFRLFFVSFSRAFILEKVEKKLNGISTNKMRKVCKQLGTRKKKGKGKIE